MNIFVGNLAHDTTEDELRALFAPFGRVLRLSIARDARSGEPRGFGFVELETHCDVHVVLSAVSGRELRGRTLTIGEAHPKHDRRRDDYIEKGAKCPDHERRGSHS